MSGDYLELAKSAKDSGNAAFQKGETAEAIDFYTQAIGLDPDDHIFYSNRSAAYLKADSISKALRDAEKCLQLKPDFVKGYNRLGAAQQGLKRFDDAIATFKKGIELAASDDALWGALRKCEQAKEAEKKSRYAAAAKERESEENRLKLVADMKVKKEAQEKIEKEQVINSTVSLSSDDLLGNFFSDLQEVEEKKDEVKEETSKGQEKGEFHEKYLNQDLGTGKAQHERLTAPNWQFRNLNPYSVLDLDIDATEEDIKNRYRKMSSKVHPDKNRDIENARDAFEEVKKAYNRLKDENQRKTVVANVEAVREDVIAERKRLEKQDKGKGKEGSKTELVPLEEEITKAVMKHFAEQEMVRRRTEKNQRSHSAREKYQAIDEQTKLKKDHTFEKEWTAEDRRDKRVGNWRDFAGNDSKRAKKTQSSSYKTETVETTKFGQATTEEWKKDWK